MANKEQLRILKQGVDAWNNWRAKTPDTDIDLTEANLIGANLSEVDFSNANLRGANLIRVILSGANLSGATLQGAGLRQADLRGANLIRANLRTFLSRANLSGAKLVRADLYGAFLIRANLSRADLMSANLNEADLDFADLSRARLERANLRQAKLTATDFTKAQVGGTIFENLDLSKARGLEEVIHLGPSNISREVFAYSKGKIPEVFLQGCGLSDWETLSVKLHNPHLPYDQINEILYNMYDLRAGQAFQISPLFISYSHADREFVDRVGDRLSQKGVRYWRDIHDMKASRMEKQIDRAIRQNPTVLLVLSENSLSSDWVEHEVHTARKLEKELGRDTLCPVALDDSWKVSKWEKRLIEQIMKYNILDFSAWNDDSKFEGMFRKLIDGLELFYKN
jgi:hypothetical protein